MAEEGSQGGGGLLRKVAAASLALATAGLGFYHYRQMKKDIEDEKLERKSFVEELRSHDLDWINAREWLWGAGFITTGGRQGAEEWCDEATALCIETTPLDGSWMDGASTPEGAVTKKEMRVLDVACCTGGAALYLSQRGTHVDAYHPSAAMIERAQSHQQAAGVAPGCCHFACADVQEATLPQEGYELIYLLDGSQQLGEVWLLEAESPRRVSLRKGDLFQKLFRALQPGGVLFVVDFVCRDEGFGACSTHFAFYAKSRGIELCTTAQYRRELVEAGFEVRWDRDETSKLEAWTKQELAKLVEEETSFKRAVKEGHYHADMRKTWQWKDECIRVSKDMKLVAFAAIKPSASI